MITKEVANLLPAQTASISQSLGSSSLFVMPQIPVSISPEDLKSAVDSTLAAAHAALRELNYEVRNVATITFQYALTMTRPDLVQSRVSLRGAQSARYNLQLHRTARNYRHSPCVRTRDLI